MAKEKHVANYNAPIRMQGANIKTVQCRDCAHRLRRPFTINGETFDSGAVKDSCDVYPRNSKPLDILFEKSKCKYYKSENQ